MLYQEQLVSYNVSNEIKSTCVPSEHESPVQPSGHVQIKEDRSLAQTPPFSQGLSSQ